MSKKIKKKIPKLRFPEFKGDWESKYLDQVGDFKNGFNADKQAFGTGVEFVNLMDIFGKSEIQKIYLDRVEIPEKQLQQYKIQKGDVLFVRSSVKREGVGQSCLVNDDFEDTVYSGFIIRFREKSNTLYHLYKKYCFTESSFRKEILSFATSSANTNINQDSLSQISLFYPSIAEQEKIASFLGAIDTRLTQLRRKHELLQTYKRGVMQKIFSQEVRFKGSIDTAFPDWKEKELKSIATVNPPSNYFPDQFLYIDLERVNNGLLSEPELINKEDAPSRAQRVLQKGDIFYQTVRPYQRNNLFFNLDGDYIASTGYAQLRAKENQQFLYQLIYSDSFVDKVISRCTGTSYPAINSSDLANVSIFFPTSIKEQEKIADFLTAIDQKIEAVARQIDRTEQFKKGLLQKMFV